MAIVRLNPNLLEIDGVVRVERGPKTCVAIATPALLDDSVTAAHYKANPRHPADRVAEQETVDAISPEEQLAKLKQAFNDAENYDEPEDKLAILQKAIVQQSLADIEYDSAGQFIDKTNLPLYRDAMGKPIYEGDEITYLDWLGDHWYHVYQWEAYPEPNSVGDLGKWIKVGEFQTEAEAVSEATKIALQIGANN